MIISYHSYYENKPSFFQIEACGDATVLKIPKKDVEGLIEQSHEFARWMLTMHMGQLYTYEKRHKLINGTAKERLEAIIMSYSVIIKNVQLQTIASYLGITPSYLSRLIKQYKSENKLM